MTSLWICIHRSSSSWAIVLLLNLWSTASGPLGEEHQWSGTGSLFSVFIMFSSYDVHLFKFVLHIINSVSADQFCSLLSIMKALITYQFCSSVSFVSPILLISLLPAFSSCCFSMMQLPFSHRSYYGLNCFPPPPTPLFRGWCPISKIDVNAMLFGDGAFGK